MIEGMDASIGKLLKAISEELDRNTIVIFTSDNGPFAANVKPLRGEKGYLYEGGIRVPMIVRWPGHQAGSRTAVITMDIHATILAATNLKSHSTNTADGISLLPLLEHGADLKRNSICFHYPNYAFHKGNRMASIRSGDHKLLWFYDDDSVELYNLANDISESRTLPTKTLNEPDGCWRSFSCGSKSHRQVPPDE